MNIACLDLEGVLIPETWVNFAEKVGVEELKATTRDIPDYDELIRFRLDLVAKHGFRIQDIQDVIRTLTPLECAKAFADQLRADYQLIIDDEGRITDYKLRKPDHKCETVKRLHELNYKVVAAGASYNDTTMLAEAEQGILFCPPQNVIDDFPQFPVANSYQQLRAQIDTATGKMRSRLRASD
jgi:phosphoserine/homoserine phosphotransferase